MNGIIHNCTHKDTHETSFRLTEEEMFIRIFNYIEHLFSKIKPKKLFFMAIDGVAPRAKMNQQRARRFRTALDAEKAREKALQNGEELPKEEPFDSNCITPGTEFMAKLSKQLQYFVHKKVTEDTDWQGCEIVLSGHEVPGEGEHKIMEYIRNAKAQPNYGHNIRHCLYGLDADLIMLGLLSHDPHFCLLREEVTFGRQAKTQSKELEHQNFYLLHLCMVREYLESEFQELKKPGVMSFAFDMEKVIDDFILMAFFVGNDFLPNLPGLHINEGALADMFSYYKEVLPTCDGYINEDGVINVDRLAKLLAKLEKIDHKNFERETQDQKWLQSKKHVDEKAAAQSMGKKLVMTKSQRKLWELKIRNYLTNRATQKSPLNLGANLNASDRKFVQDLADRFRMPWSTKPDDDGQRNLVIQFPEISGDLDDEDEEMFLAINREIKRYENAEIAEMTAEEAKTNFDLQYEEKFQKWKDDYYEDKLHWQPENMEQELTIMCQNYVQGLQWVLYYYYRGIASWPWFYRYHYSPKITDIRKGLGADMTFELGQPFQPFEQLMGVLPDRSKKIVPKAYWDLMTDKKSPIIDFYPRDFQLDMNGKKMEWEAVVLIPFIDEKRLLNAMETKNDLLLEDERQRNTIGYAIRFAYDPRASFSYPSSLVGVFPDIENCHCAMNHFEMPSMDGLQFRVGLMDDVKLNAEALAGFPSLATLPFNAVLGFHGVSVFQQESRNQSVVVTLEDTEIRANVKAAKMKVGQRCYVGYPFLQEAKIVRVSEAEFNYTLENGHVVQRGNSPREMEDFKRKAEWIERHYSKRFAIIIDTVEALVHVEHLKGLQKTDLGAHVKEYGVIPGQETDWPVQLVVDEVINEDERFLEREALPIEEEFPLNSIGFFLGDFNYGRPAKVIGHDKDTLKLAISALEKKEPNFSRPVIARAERENKYVPSHELASQVGIHPMILSKVTASFFVHTLGGLKVNLGLNLKFEAKKQKVLGYTKKSTSGWEYSPAAITLIADYITNFPEFFAALTRLRSIQSSGSTTELKDIDLFPDQKFAQQRIKEIGSWLKSIETSKFERVPLDAEQLDSNVVMALSEAAAEAHNLSSIKRTVIGGVPRNAFIKPSDAIHRLGNQRFALGDRVTYIQDAGKVRLASRGTVVGISRTATTKLLDVVFDETFMSGSSLGERCPPFRGMTVQAQAVLNTTDKQVIKGSKASQNQSKGPSTTIRRGGGSAMSVAYRDASVPPPLRGSFSGIVNGSHRGKSRPGHSRGDPPQGPQRSNPNIIHSTLVYRPSPDQQQQKQQQQQQQQEPLHGHQQRFPHSRGAFRGNRSRGRSQFNYQANSTMRTSSSPTQAYNTVPPPPTVVHSNIRGDRGRGRGRGGSRGAGRGGRGVARGGGQAAPAA